MNRLLIRAMAMMLIPALLWDPALAFAPGSPALVANIDRFLLEPVIAASFCETALTLPIVQSQPNLVEEHTNRTAQLWRLESLSLTWRFALPLLTFQSFGNAAQYAVGVSKSVSEHGIALFLAHPKAAPSPGLIFAGALFLVAIVIALFPTNFRPRDTYNKFFGPLEPDGVTGHFKEFRKKFPFKSTASPWGSTPPSPVHEDPFIGRQKGRLAILLEEAAAICNSRRSNREMRIERRMNLSSQGAAPKSVPNPSSWSA